ncbi:hypothetical protein BS78_04G155500 [Paspalum vaginatum]|nr:hypothetical protein BS78_04G155500 [Paspalum vaginatum]
MEVLARKRVESEKAALEQRIEELEQERMVQERQIAETNSHHGSNSRHHPSPRSEEFVGEAHHLDQGGQDDYADNEDYDHYDENLLVHSHAAAPLQSHLNITTTPTNNDSAQFSHDTLVGNDVILYALLRSDQPVAKGTIISTNPNTMVEGESLGKQYCEVIITVVLKRDAILPRPYTGVETMLDAHMMSIAWPYKKLKVCKRASSHGTVGSSGGAR